MPESYGEAKERVMSDMRVLLADTEELLRAVASESKDKIAAVRPRVEHAVAQTRLRLNEIEHAIEYRAARAAREADAYVHDNPWKTAGMAAGLGAALGAILGVLISRR